ncbi:MAG: DUF6228 family protein [Pseudonocardiaceae bacterium]
MRQLILDGINGRRLVLNRTEPGDEDGVWSYEATLLLPAGSTATPVWDLGDTLARFLRDLAESWRGFDSQRSFRSLESQLKLDCHHDGVGTVTCMVSLGSVAPPTWALTAELDLGAGAHLDEIANQAERFCADR